MIDIQSIYFLLELPLKILVSIANNLTYYSRMSSLIVNVFSVVFQILLKSILPFTHLKRIKSC